MLSCVQLLAIPWTVACQAPLSMEFSRQEYWSGQPFPSPGDLPDPGIGPTSASQVDSFFFFLQVDSLLLGHLGSLNTYTPFPNSFSIVSYSSGSDCKESAAMQQTWVPSLGEEDLLEKGMATHSSILASRIPWTEEPGGLQSMGTQRVWHDWAKKFFLIL